MPATECRRGVSGPDGVEAIAVLSSFVAISRAKKNEQLIFHAEL